VAIVVSVARQCIFCENDANSLEHVVPAWIPSHLGLSALRLDRIKRKRGDTRKTDGPFGHVTARIFCDGCQKHFAGLEAFVKSLLLPMIDGGTARVYRHWEQRFIALWATKTAYALLAREKWPLPREEERYWVRNENEPSPWTLVLAVPYSGSQIRFMHEPRRWPAIPSEKPGEATDTYSIVMVFGHVAFKVFGFLNPPPNFAMGEPHYLDPSGEAVPLAVKFWPPPKLGWPGEVPTIGDDSIDDLAALWPFTASPDPIEWAVEDEPGLDESR
jgi:hypothetical protein